MFFFFFLNVFLLGLCCFMLVYLNIGLVCWLFFFGDLGIREEEWTRHEFMIYY